MASTLLNPFGIWIFSLSWLSAYTYFLSMRNGFSTLNVMQHIDKPCNIWMWNHTYITWGISFIYSWLPQTQDTKIDMNYFLRNSPNIPKDPPHKSHDDLNKYTTMHHFVRKMCTKVKTIVSAMWDMGLVHCGISATDLYLARHVLSRFNINDPR